MKTDKRQLFFDRSRKTYIEFDLEKTKTCEEIYNSLNKEIEQKISELYGDKNNKNFNFNFIMIYSRSNKLENTSNIEIKLDPTALLSDIMTNKQYFLCYLPPNEFNISLKKKVRNKFEEEENNFADRFKDVERDILSNHTIEKYLSNEGIYYFDKEKVEFFYGKGNVDEEKISINYKKINVPIIINEIKKEEYFENQIPPSIEVFKIKCPNYIFQIHQNNNTHFLGLYKYKSYLVWKNAINAAKIKNNNITIDSSFNVNIANYNTLLFVKSHSISSQCFIINQILQNFEKRQIFLDGYSDKKISDIINGIYSYKINIKNFADVLNDPAGRLATFLRAVGADIAAVEAVFRNRHFAVNQNNGNLRRFRLFEDVFPARRHNWRQANDIHALRDERTDGLQLVLLLLLRVGEQQFDAAFRGLFLNGYRTGLPPVGFGADLAESHADLGAGADFRSRLLLLAGHRQNHHHRDKQCQQLFHFLLLLIGFQWIIKKTLWMLFSQNRQGRDALVTSRQGRDASVAYKQQYYSIRLRGDKFRLSGRSSFCRRRRGSASR